MSIVPSLPFNLQNGQVADASQVMANLLDILNAVNANAAANGANNDITALLALTTPISPAGGGGSNVYIGSTVTGTANAVVVAATLLPTLGFTLTKGKSFWWLATATNTGAMTLNAVGSGVTAIQKQSPSGLVTLSGGEVVNGQWAGVNFDGTQYQLINNPINVLGAQTSIASAATTDLGLVPSHNALITGTVGIASFGATATVTFPLYFVQFAGALTITPNTTSLKTPGGAAINTRAGDFALVLALGSGNWQIVEYYPANAAPGGLWPPGFLTGLGLSRPSTTTFTIATGSCRNEDAGIPYNMVLGSALTKSTSAWLAGTGNGGLDTGAIANNTWYHVHPIRKDSDGTLDAIISLSVAAPTIPAGYTARRRIGSLLTDGSAHFIDFAQVGDSFKWLAPVIDVNAANPGTSAVSRPLSTPLGVVTIAEGFGGYFGGSTSNNSFYFSSLDVTDTAPVAPTTASLAAAFMTGGNTNGVIWTQLYMQVRTDTSSQIRSRLFASAASDRIGWTTIGWIDNRGKL